MAQPTDRDDSDRLRLPNFCAARATLAVVLIVELTAVVLSLARYDPQINFWLELARVSLFLLWTGLGCAAALCVLRRPLEQLPLSTASALALAALGAVVALISIVAGWLADRFGLDGASTATGPFVLRNLIVGLIVGALALRYFYVAAEWRRNVEMQAEARVNALQARIRPHFLFNSMNTIAALTRTDPQQAESAVEDLADLFRASLSEQRSRITLKEELEVARIYQRIEQLRLGSRLQVSWDVAQLPMGALVPSLLVQPLLENAIYHGIERLRDGGIVTVGGALQDGIIELIVRNPLPPDLSSPHSGNRAALANIRERLELMYPHSAQVSAERVAEEFIVRLRFPCVEELQPA
jgi:two-component system sensor histidine kinase AlgZ